MSDSIETVFSGPVLTLADASANPYALLTSYRYSPITFASAAASQPAAANELPNQIFGDGGNNTINGTDGDDQIFAGGGNDTLSGLDGSDDLVGDRGQDNLRGGTGDDFLAGGSQNDRLFGGVGWDEVHGGSGDDQFVLSPLNTAFGGDADVILDFTTGDDVIFLSGGPASVTADNFVASLEGKALDRFDRILYETDTGKLFYDADGTGSTHKVLIAIIGQGSHALLKPTDFDT